MIGSLSRISLVVCVWVTVFSWAACGSPDRGANEDFPFTPVPYVTVQPVTGPAVLVVLDEQGRPLYVADEVEVIIEHDKRDDFLRWLDSTSFELKQWILDDPKLKLDFVVALVRVPPGSVDDALRFIEGRPGVRSVERSSIYTAQGDEGS